MGRSTVHTRRPSRFENLTPDQEKAFNSRGDTLVLSGKIRSYNGDPENAEFFKTALKGFEADVASFDAALPLTDAFVLMCNDPGRQSKRTFETLRSTLRRGVLAFAKDKGLDAKPLKLWPRDLAEQVVRWLRTLTNSASGALVSRNTARRHYGSFADLFAKLAEDSKLSGLLPTLDAFPNNPFSGAHDGTDKTKALGMSALIDTYNAARTEFLQAVAKVRYAQSLFAGPKVAPDAGSRGCGKFRDLDAVLWYLKTKFEGKLPPYLSLRDSGCAEQGALFWAISKFHGGWRNVAEYLQPSPEGCVAPMILLTIVGHFNTEPLRTISEKNLRNKTVLNNGRLEVRLTVQPGKERGKPYRRSFPIDDADPCSPSSIFQFMREWTQRVRSEAGVYRDCIFIHATMEGEVKAFFSAKFDGQGSDTKWRHHLVNFAERNALPRFNLRELRLTSLEYGMWMFADDIRASFALKGGTSERVLRESYTSDSARHRADARIAEIQSNQERFVRTKGKVHHLGSESTDRTAATPGCKCVDTFDSPLPGEVKGRQCGAFGRCPGCPLGSPELTAYGLARLLQLREELLQARTNLPLERWVACWHDVLETLERKWIPLFKDEPQLWERVKRMSLAPIGVIE